MRHEHHIEVGTGKLRLLQLIAKGQRTFAPENETFEALRKFQATARDLFDLASGLYIAGCRTQTEIKAAGCRCVGCVQIAGGLTAFGKKVVAEQ